MPRTFLSIYSIHVRERRSDQDEYLNDFGKKHDLYTLTGNYLATRQTERWIDAGIKRVLKVESHHHKYRLHWGLVKSGDFGYASEICDPDDLEVVFDRLPNQPEIIPLYFLFYLPKDETEGYLVTQRFGHRSPYSCIRDDLKHFVGTNAKGYQLVFDPVVTEGVIRTLMDGGEIARIRLISPTVPSDVSDRLPDPQRARKSLKSQVVIEAKATFRTELRSWMKQLMNNKIPLAKIFAMPGFDFEDVRVEVEHPQIGTKTLKRSDLFNIRPDIDVTDRVRFNKDGHPEFESIHDVANSLLRDITEINA